MNSEYITLSEASLVLRKAVLKAAELLDVNHKDLAKIIGISQATIYGLDGDSVKGISPKSKEGELAILFVKVFKYLDVFLGGSIENEKKWLII